MISSLRGILSQKNPTEALIDVNGVGYGVSIPISTFEKLGPAGSEVVLFTYLHVREDALQLFGFFSEEERATFRLLVSVSGIGPKMAQGILSGISVSDLRAHLASGNLLALTSIPGVGRKIAERLVVELRDKLDRLDVTQGKGQSGLPPVQGEALLALLSLGYSRSVAEKSIATAMKDLDGSSTSVEILIKAALRHAAK